MSKKSLEDTDENIELVKELYYKKRMTYTQVAKELGIGADALRHFMVRNNISRRTTGETKLLKFTNKELENIINLYTVKNLGVNEINKIYDNVERQTISNYLIRNGIKINSKRVTKTEQRRRNSLVKLNVNDDVLINLYCDENLNATDIGAIFNVSNQTVLRHLRELNIPIKNLSELLKDEKFREKHINRMHNGMIKTSMQQQYLCNLLNGTLNYPVRKVFLDIAFPEEMIYCEYDGGFHDGQVQLGHITEEEFNKKENRRKFMLRDLGWKEIRIISRKDKIPAKPKILKMIDFAKKYLNSGHHYMLFDIDKQTIKCSQYESLYDYGRLRRIKDKDLKEVV